MNPSASPRYSDVLQAAEGLEDGSGSKSDTLPAMVRFYPGPVALIGRNGVVLNANAEAAPLIELLRSGQNKALQEAVFGAIEGKVCEISPLLLAQSGPAAGQAAAFDILTLPWSRNTTALLLARDMTLQRCRQDALVSAKCFMEGALALAVDFAWHCDTGGRFLALHPADVLGHRASDLLGQDAAAFLVRKGGRSDNPFCSDIPLDAVEALFRNVAGRSRRLSLTVRPQFAADGTWTGSLGTARCLPD